MKNMNQPNPQVPATDKSLFHFLLTQPASKIYLVGGAVRDELLGKTSHDLDFIVEGDVFSVARALADHLQGYFYILDQSRSYARVLYTDDGAIRHIFDFAPVLDHDLEKDLRSRDFTINAIAREIAPMEGQLSDPCDGIRDLHKKLLRQCSPTCFHDDPVRIIRVARFTVGYGLQLTPELMDSASIHVSDLDSVSQERKRDEFFKILDGENVEKAVSILYDLGVLESFLPELLDLSKIQPGPPHIHDGWHVFQIVLSK